MNNSLIVCASRSHTLSSVTCRSVTASAWR